MIGWDVHLLVRDSANFLVRENISIFVENVEPKIILDLDGLTVGQGDEIMINSGVPWVINASSSYDTVNDLDSLTFEWYVDEVKIESDKQILTNLDVDIESSKNIMLIIYDDDQMSDDISFTISVSNLEEESISFGVVLLSGISISLRISGIIFIFVTVLFSIIYQLNLEKKSWSEVISYCSKFSAISVFTFLLVSPASWFSPIEFISTSLNQQIFLGWTGSTLTNGTFIPAKNISSFYLITWFFYKLPIVYNLLIVASILGLYFNVLRKDIFYQFSVYFLLFVNIAFVLYKPEVYDGIRQFLFLLPFIIYISRKYCIPYIEICILEFIFFKNNRIND